MARSYAFTDQDGNQFLFPGLVVSDHEHPDVINAMMYSVCLNLKKGSEYYEFDADNFPHYRQDVYSRALAHGGTTVLLFAGPAFDKLSAAEQETEHG